MKEMVINNQNKSLYIAIMAIMLIMLCDMPIINNNSIYRIMRGSRAKWIGSEIISIVIYSVVFIFLIDIILMIGGLDIYSFEAGLFMEESLCIMLGMILLMIFIGEAIMLVNLTFPNNLLIVLLGIILIMDNAIFDLLPNTLFVLEIDKIDLVKIFKYISPNTHIQEMTSMSQLTEPITYFAVLIGITTVLLFIKSKKTNISNL